MLGRSVRTRILMVCHCYRERIQLLELFQPEKQQKKNEIFIIKRGHDEKRI